MFAPLRIGLTQGVFILGCSADREWGWQKAQKSRCDFKSGPEQWKGFFHKEEFP